MHTHVERMRRKRALVGGKQRGGQPLGVNICSRRSAGHSAPFGRRCRCAQHVHKVVCHTVQQRRDVMHALRQARVRRT